MNEGEREMKVRRPNGLIIDMDHVRTSSWCRGIKCDNCPVGLEAGLLNANCSNYVEAFPRKAATLMGYKVIEEGEEKVQENRRKQILQEAEKCVCGEREQSYGKPENNFENIGLLWGIYLNAAHPVDLKNFAINGITAKDVAAMMALLKIARIATGHGKMDNWVDLAGYAACGGEIEGRDTE